ncbi:unnamed protein product [Gongylonema pulchrum]|uniref:Clc-like protein n=1 Tax=Gongylonema pulchrum TaxID=637853 RepID=A0A183DU68_9BILA|nr:unnamed protein product [Gongylonema pulchrum]
MGHGQHGAQKVVLVASLVLLLIALGLSIAAVLSPSWQVVDIREFRAQHHHGLWQDCTRPYRHAHTQTIEEYNEMLHTALSCTYKFDADARWQKAVLICFGVLFASCGLALLCGSCAPCSNSIAVLFTVLIFVALFFSIVANGIFFFAAHRVDSRFVQGLVGTYEQEIGSAFFLSLGASAVLLFSFVLALASTYHLLHYARKPPPNQFNSPMVRELAPLYSATTRHTAI